MPLVRLHVCLLLVWIVWGTAWASAHEKPGEEKPDEALIAARHLLLTGK